jgi:hypothetical protein
MKEQDTLYKYLSPDSAIKVLSSSTLRWSAPSLFNDIFDVPEELFSDFKESEFQGELSSQFISAINAADSSSADTPPIVRKLLNMAEICGIPPEIVAKVVTDDIITTPLTVGYYEAVEKLNAKWKELRQEHRILCLTRKWDQVSMWDRYADKHTGIVLEFSCDRDSEAPFKLAQRVKYSDEPLSMSTTAGHVNMVFSANSTENLKEIFKEYTHTKTTEWTTEKEWRIATFRKGGEGGDYSDYEFPKESLRSCTLGLSMDEEQKNEIMTLLSVKYPSAEIWVSVNAGGRKLSRTIYEGNK